MDKLVLPLNCPVRVDTLAEISRPRSGHSGPGHVMTPPVSHLCASRPGSAQNIPNGPI